MSKNNGKKNKPKIVLNSVLHNMSEPLDFNKKTKKIKFLNVMVEFGRKAIILNWAAQGIGFGQVTYYFNDLNQLIRDDERVGDEFCLKLIEEIRKNEEKLPESKKKIKNKGLTVCTDIASYLQALNQASIKQ